MSVLSKGLLMSRSASGDQLSSLPAPQRKVDFTPGAVPLPFGQVCLSSMKVTHCTRTYPDGTVRCHMHLNC